MADLIPALKLKILGALNLQEHLSGLQFNQAFIMVPLAYQIFLFIAFPLDSSAIFFRAALAFQIMAHEIMILVVAMFAWISEVGISGLTREEVFRVAEIFW